MTKNNPEKFPEPTKKERFLDKSLELFDRLPEQVQALLGVIVFSVILSQSEPLYPDD